MKLNIAKEIRQLLVPEISTVKQFIAKGGDVGTLIVKAPNEQMGYWMSKDGYNKEGKGTFWLYNDEGNKLEETDTPYCNEGFLPQNIAGSENWKVPTRREIEERFPHFKG